MRKPQSIGILATGDELVEGNILNTTAPFLADTLNGLGFTISKHITVPDEQKKIENALRDLLQDNAVVITTGGLGPTSDDLTRFAIATVSNRALVFDQLSWNNIINTFKRGNIPLTENNRQQAYFPEGAQVLHNKYGTANGCLLHFDDKIIIMLPGPPNECYDVFFPEAQTFLLNAGIHHPIYRKKWRVFGISESWIADELDKLTKKYAKDIVLSYRIDYPYIEIKLRASTKKLLNAIEPIITEFLHPYQINTLNEKASILLAQYCNKHPLSFYISDQLGFGYWQNKLWDLAEFSAIHFTQDIKKADFSIFLSGNLAFPPATEKSNTRTVAGEQQNYTIQLEIKPGPRQLNKKPYTTALSITYRQKRTMIYATEQISQAVLAYLSQAPSIY